MVQAATHLQKMDPGSWPKEQVVRISREEPVYLLRVGDDLTAFVRFLEPGQIELIDIAREATIRQFLERYREAETAV